MRDESVPNRIQGRELEAIVANLQEMAEQADVKLPTDVALFIAQNFQSNSSALRRALIRVVAYSVMTGTEISLAYTQRVLRDSIGKQPGGAAVDLLQGLPSQPFGTKKSENTRQDPIAAGRDFVLCLLKTREGRKLTRVRLEVNMRETERERLARRDAYERDLERCAKRRKQG